MTDFAAPPGYKLIVDRPVHFGLHFRVTVEDGERLAELGRILGGLSAGQAARWVLEQQSVQNLIDLTIETSNGSEPDQG